MYLNVPQAVSQFKHLLHKINHMGRSERGNGLDLNVLRKIVNGYQIVPVSPPHQWQNACVVNSNCVEVAVGAVELDIVLHTVNRATA